MDIEAIINEIKEKSQYRTRYAGQEPRWDESLVAEIERLRKYEDAARDLIKNELTDGSKALAARQRLRELFGINVEATNGRH